MLISCHISFVIPKEIALRTENLLLPRCTHCQYPLASNPNTVFVCMKCCSTYHCNCIWGELYPNECENWKEGSKKPRVWLCGHCLVKKSLRVFDLNTQQWDEVYVISYNSRSRTHLIKKNQDMKAVRLGHWRVQLCCDTNEYGNCIENTMSNSSVIELKGNIRSYKQISQLNGIKSFGYHSFPQIVFFSNEFEI